MGAVNVRSGEMRYFDSRDEALDLRHVMASGAMPPAFPPVRIGDELYWDGGIYSNTPVEAVFDDNPRRSSLVFAVQLWQPEGEAPRNMWQVSGRQKDIQFASRVNSHVQRQAQIHQLRHIVRELTRALPAAALASPRTARDGRLRLRHRDAPGAADGAAPARRGPHQGHGLQRRAHPAALAGRTGRHAAQPGNSRPGWRRWGRWTAWWCTTSNP